VQISEENIFENDKISGSIGGSSHYMERSGEYMSGRRLIRILSSILITIFMTFSFNAGCGLSPASAQETNILSLVGQAGGRTSCMACANGYLYVGIGRQVKIVKDTDGIFADIATTGLLPSGVTAVEVSGGRLYAACSDGFFCYDIGKLPAVTKVYSVDAVGVPRQIKAFGEYLLIADGLSGIKILDKRGKLITTVYGDQDCLDMAVAGKTLYIAAGTAGLLTADISDPAKPVPLSTTDTPGFAWNVDLNGSRAYIADGSEGVCIIDITKASSPKVIANEQTAGMALDVAAQGGSVFVADAYRGVRKLVNASNGKAVDGGSFEYDTCETEGLLLTGDILYARDPGYGVVRLDSQASPLAMTGYYGITLPVSQNPPAFIGRGYDENGGFFELSLLYTLGLIGEWPNDGSIDAPMFRKDFVTFYQKLGVSLAKTNAETVDLPVSWEDAIKNAISLAGLTGGSDMRASGKKLGLTFRLNMTKKNPSVKDIYKITGRALILNTPVTEKSSYAKKLASRQKFGNVQVVFDVKIKGHYAYAATDAGLAVFDIQTPSAPVLAAFYPVEGKCDRLCINGDYIFVHNFGVHALFTFDISSPTVPKMVGYYKSPLSQNAGIYREVACRNNILYMPDEMGLETVDCSDPYNLKPLSYFIFDNRCASGIALVGDYAYIGAEHNGINGADISDPERLKVIDTGIGRGDIGMTEFMATDGDRLYVPSSNGKLTVYTVQSDGSLKYALDVNGTMEWNITGPDNGIICTLGKRITAFRLSGDGVPAEIGNISNIESNVIKGDLKDGVLALVSNNGLYIAEIGDAGRAVQKPKASPTAPSVKGLSVAMPGTTIKSTRTYGSTLQLSSFSKAKKLVVTSTADTGKGTLRDCLSQCVGQDWYIVTFDPKVFPPKKPAEILLKTPLPCLYRTWIDASNAGVILNCANFSKKQGDTPVTLSQDCIFMGMTIMNYPRLPLEAAFNNIIGGNRKIGSGLLGQGNAFYTYMPVEDLVQNDVRLFHNNTLKGNLFGIDVLHPEKRDALTLIRAVSMCSNNQVGSTVDGEQNIFDRVDTAMYLCEPQVVNNLITGNIIGYTLDGKESGCIFEAIVIDMCIGNIVTHNKVSEVGRSAIVCTGITGGSYNVIKNNEAIDHQVERSELGFFFLGNYNVIEGNRFTGQVELYGFNNVFSGNDVRYIGQLGSLMHDGGELGGNFIGGMGPGAGNVFGADDPSAVSLSINANAGPFIRGNIFYCRDWFCYEGDHSKTAFCNNTVYTNTAVLDAFQKQLGSFGAASGNVNSFVTVPADN